MEFFPDDIIDGFEAARQHVNAKKGIIGIKGKHKDQEMAVWKGKNVLLVVVANYAKRPARVNCWLDFPKLIQKPSSDQQRVVMNFENLGRPEMGLVRGKEFPDDRMPRLDGGSDATINIPNTLSVKIEPRDFRAYLIANLPLGGSGAGF